MVKIWIYYVIWLNWQGTQFPIHSLFILLFKLDIFSKNFKQTRNSNSIVFLDNLKMEKSLSISRATLVYDLTIAMGFLMNNPYKIKTFIIF
jgi:hypothetical protein